MKSQKEIENMTDCEAYKYYNKVNVSLTHKPEIWANKTFREKVMKAQIKHFNSFKKHTT